MKYFQKSDIFLIGAAFISFVLSVSLWFYGYKDEGLFVDGVDLGFFEVVGGIVNGE